MALLTATVKLDPTYSANFDSNSKTLGPYKIVRSELTTTASISYVNILLKWNYFHFKSNFGSTCVLINPLKDSIVSQFFIFS